MPTEKADRHKTRETEKVINDVEKMMNFLYSKQNNMVAVVMLLLCCALGSSYAANQLGTFGVVTYDITHGLATTVPIAFQSDFPANTAETATLDEVFFTYELGGNAATYYTANSLSINTAGPGVGELQVGLTPDVIGPTIVGVYTLTIAIDMYYKNSAGDTLMHYKTYTITLYKQGSASVYSLNSGSIVMPNTNIGESSGGGEGGEGGGEPDATLPPEVVEEVVNPNPQTFESVVPQDLTLSSGPADGGGEEGGGGGEEGGGGGEEGGGSEPVGQDEDVEVTVGSESTPTLRVWLDATAQIEVYSDSGLTNLVYVWPTELVQGAEDEGAASNMLSVQLENVPVGLYSIGTIYIKFVIKLRDTAGDPTTRRLSLRSIAGGRRADNPSTQHRALERQEASSLGLAALVRFDSAFNEEASEGTRLIPKFMVATMSAAAFAGSAILAL